MKVFKSLYIKLIIGHLLQHFGLSIGRLTLISSVALTLGMFASWSHYKGYWKGTIRRVQTVDFNLLSHTLPTKLSYALLNKDIDEIQRTLDSNYGLFGLVVTDCKTQKTVCPNEKVLFISNSTYQWKQQFSPEQLHQFPYSSLQDPPPLYAERKFNSPRDETWTMTDTKNQGLIIGRVYYLRGIPPKFSEDIKNWSLQLPNSLLSDSGADKYYSLTFILSLFGGFLSWGVLECTLFAKQANEELAKSKANTLKRQLNIISRIKSQQEKAYGELEKSQQKQKQYQQNLSNSIDQLKSKLEKQQQERSSLTHQLENLQQLLNETQEQNEAELQQKEQDIVDLEKQLISQQKCIKLNTEELDSAYQELDNAQESQQQSQTDAERLQLSISQLQKKYERLHQSHQNLLETTEEKEEEYYQFYQQAFEEDINKLSSQNHQLLEEQKTLRLNNDQLQSRVNFLCYHLESYLNKYHQLQVSIYESNKDQRNTADFIRVVDVVLAVREDFGDIFRVWDNAIRSAESLTFRPWTKVYQAFKTLADIGQMYFLYTSVELSIGPWKNAFQERGFSDHYRATDSQATLNKFGQERVFYFQGERRQMVKHLTLRQGDHCLQIYFDINRELQKIDIGYCGKHLPTVNYQ
ncbi:MAG: hypothetical protein AB4062_11995 [Crocosphaera sp.]